MTKANPTRSGSEPLPRLSEVALTARDPAQFAEVLDPEEYEAFVSSLDRARALLEGRTLWNLNSTSQGGGVSEVLGYLVPYFRGAGTDCRWVVIEGHDEFFEVTKRLHNLLHGADGEEGTLGSNERRVYDETLEPNAHQLGGLVRPRESP